MTFSPLPFFFLNFFLPFISFPFFNLQVNQETNRLRHALSIARKELELETQERERLRQESRLQFCLHKRFLFSISLSKKKQSKERNSKKRKRRRLIPRKWYTYCDLDGELINVLTKQDRILYGKPKTSQKKQRKTTKDSKITNSRREKPVSVKSSSHKSSKSFIHDTDNSLHISAFN